MTHQQLFTCLFLLAFIPLSVNAFPPPSPAGGNYLALDGVDDYAVLDFEAFGILLPKDTSDNAYHLAGKDGAKTGIPLAVKAQGKLTTIWAQLKQ